MEKTNMITADDMRRTSADDFDIDDMKNMRRQFIMASASERPQPITRQCMARMLVQFGMPEWEHGKKYALSHAGEMLNRMTKMGLLVKTSSGKWVVA
jgi:hypothetical protein